MNKSRTVCRCGTTLDGVSTTMQGYAEPKRPSRLCHVCNAHLPHHLALIYPQSSTLSNCPTIFSPLPSPFPPLLRPPTLFFCYATRCRAAAAHRRLSCAPIYKRSREHRSRWTMMIHRPVGDGQSNASPLSEGVALYDIFCPFRAWSALAAFSHSLPPPPSLWS